jgi:hypothetical protein
MSSASPQLAALAFAQTDHPVGLLDHWQPRNLSCLIQGPVHFSRDSGHHQGASSESGVGVGEGDLPSQAECLLGPILPWLECFVGTGDRKREYLDFLYW